MQYIGLRSDEGTLPTAGMYFDNYGGVYTADGPLEICEISGGALAIEENDKSHLFKVSGDAMCTTVTNI